MVETGLLRRRDRTDLADSPDGVLLIEQTLSESRRHMISALEMKTAASQSTESSAWRRIQDFPAGKRVIEVEFGSELFKKLVWTSNHRGQVLQHAVVLEVDYCTFAVASAIEIIYIVMVHVPLRLRQIHLRVTQVLCRKHLMWYRDPPHNAIEFPRDFELGYAVDEHTVKVWRKTAAALQEDKEQRALDPVMALRPPAHDLVPEIIAMWNKHKGIDSLIFYFIYFILDSVLILH